MITHCSNLAWRITWTEEPAGLQSIIWLCEHTAINIMSCFCFGVHPRTFYIYIELIYVLYIYITEQTSKENEWYSSVFFLSG